MFYAVWTVGAAVAVWWLVSAAADRPDLLIAVDQGEGASRRGMVRHWMDPQVEIHRTYGWMLLAPYVIGLSLRWALDRRDLAGPWALHLLLGAGFITASQALTRRLDSLRPRAIRIQREEVVRRVGPPGSNDPAPVLITRTVEWHREAPDPMAATPDGTSSPHTGLPAPGVPGDPRIFAWGETVDLRGGTEPGLPTNPPASAKDVARRLAPMIEAELREGFGPGPAFGPRRFSMVLDGLAFVTLVGIAQAIHFRRRLGEREAQAVALESRLVQARLHTLQAQLQPHFLFNALNGIATLVRRDPRTAEEMLASLSELLRASLSGSGCQEIPLRDELDFLERYLELQQMRFGDRLTVERDIAPGTRECLVPALVLQPLVENAIRHGIEPSSHPGRVRIAARCADADLVLEVTDNGVGLSGAGRGPASPGGGLGLSSVQERLAGLYGERQDFRLEEGPDGGVQVRIRIPARPAAGSAPGIPSAGSPGVS
ncbi:MAG: histidine kinase [Verrucomicrobia bacterium]|nr:histidine kinase [Verrucomicrobiota bacterium]